MVCSPVATSTPSAIDGGTAHTLPSTTMRRRGSRSAHAPPIGREQQEREELRHQAERHRERPAAELADRPSECDVLAPGAELRHAVAQLHQREVAVAQDQDRAGEARPDGDHEAVMVAGRDGPRRQIRSPACGTTHFRTRGSDDDERRSTGRAAGVGAGRVGGHRARRRAAARRRGCARGPRGAAARGLRGGGGRDRRHRDRPVVRRHRRGAVPSGGGGRGRRASVASTTSSTPPVRSRSSRSTSADAEWWRTTFETNVMGAALITKYALPHVQAGAGVVRLPVVGVEHRSGLARHRRVHRDQGCAQPHGRHAAARAHRGRVHPGLRRPDGPRPAPAPTST